MAERKRYCVTYFKLWGAAQVYNTTNDKDIAMDWVDSANWDSHMAVDRDTGEVIHWYIKGGSNISFQVCGTGLSVSGVTGDVKDKAMNLYNRAM